MAESGPNKRPTSAAAYSSADDGDPEVNNSDPLPTPETDPRKAMVLLPAAQSADVADAGRLSGSQQTGTALPDALWFSESHGIQETMAPRTLLFAAAPSTIIATRAAASSFTARNGAVVYVQADVQLQARQLVKRFSTLAFRLIGSDNTAQPFGVILSMGPCGAHPYTDRLQAPILSRCRLLKPEGLVSRCSWKQTAKRMPQRPRSPKSPEYLLRDASATRVRALSCRGNVARLGRNCYDRGCC